MTKLWVVCLGLFVSVGIARADLLVGWNVGGLHGTNENLSANTIADDIASAVLSRGPGIAPSAATNSFLSNSWTMPAGSTISDAILSNDYFSITITAEAGFTLNVTNLSWFVNRSATGPSNLTLRSSADGFATDLATWLRSGTSAGEIGTPLAISGVNSIEFRIYGAGATAAAGSLRVADGGNIGDTGIDLGVFGSVVPEPGTILLMGAGLIALTASRRKIRRQA
ncbi:MAG TPA: PEP-CTERM sorting domain-containing protein [Kiritimatiellia bacterium]|nr:PEP-CTERM sorting domain-containing protein [Kiritimatiellia bacterium]